MIEALPKKELTVKNKNLLLQITMQLLKRSSRDDLDLKLIDLSNIALVLSDLFCESPEYQQTAWDFATIFTNCEPASHFCSLVSGH